MTATAAPGPTSLDCWSSTWTELGLRPPALAVYRALLAHYAEAHRAYHTRQHLDECLHLLDEVRNLAGQPAEVALALWFHDAVYDPRQHDNEARSAQWLVLVATQAGAAPEVCERLHALVMATCHRATPQETDARLLVDIDLAILGAPVERFEEYEQQIRREYAWVEPALYRQVRGRVLADFLSRPRLYSTAKLRQRFEQAARANLSRSIERLGSGC